MRCGRYQLRAEKVLSSRRYDNGSFAMRTPSEFTSIRAQNPSNTFLVTSAYHFWGGPDATDQSSGPWGGNCVSTCSKHEEWLLRRKQRSGDRGSARERGDCFF